MSSSVTIPDKMFAYTWASRVIPKRGMIDSCCAHAYVAPLEYAAYNRIRLDRGIASRRMATIHPFTCTNTNMYWFFALTPYRACEGIFSLIFPLYLFNILRLPASSVGLLVGLVSFGAVAGSIFWGYVSDRYHTRRAFMVMGCTLGGMCLAALSLFSHFAVAIVPLCFAFGFFSIAPAPIASVLIMESLPKLHWDRAFAQYNKIGGWGWIVGLFLGVGVLPALERWLPLDRSMHLILCGLGALMVGTAWWALRTIPESSRQVDRDQFIAATQSIPSLNMIERALYLPRRLLFVLQPSQILRFRAMMPTRAFLSYMAATTIMFVGFIMVMTPFSLFLQDVYHLNTSLIFALTLIRALTSAPCYALAARWANWFGPHRVQSWALVCRLVAFCALGALALVSDMVLVLAILIIVNVLIGISWSGIAVAGPALVGHLSNAGHQGEAMGIYNAAQGVAQICGAMLGGCLAYWIGYYNTFVVAGLLLIPAILLLLGSDSKDTSAPGEHEQRNRIAA